MKIGNDPKKYMDPNDKDSNDQQGITIGNQFIPYTWIIIGVGVITMVGIFIGVMTGEGSNAEPDPDSEVVETLDEQDEEEDSKDRIWDSYLDDAAGTEDVSDADAPEDDEGSADEVAGDDTDEPEAPTVTDEEMAETIKAFLTAFQIHGPGDTAQDRYDSIYPYVTEELANKLVPNRGAEDAGAGPSIDVIHELEDIRIDPVEGVDNEYVATIIYTREAMSEVLKFTDVYTIRTNGERVTAATIRSSSWE